MLRLLINLDRSPDRLQIMKKELSTLKISFERIAAVDGALLSDEYIKSITPRQYSKEKLWFPYNLIKTEYACFLSHRKCWSKLIDSDQNFALIIEDDIKFSHDASQYIFSSDWIPTQAKLIQVHSPKEPQSFQVNSNKLNPNHGIPGTLYEIIHPTPNGTPAYIISKEAAFKALELSSQIGGPVDEFLFSIKSPLRKYICPYKLNPGNGKPTDLASTILSQPRQRTKPYLCRLHPFSIWLKLRSIYLKTLNPQTEIFL